MAKVGVVVLLKCFNTLINSPLVKQVCGDEFITHLLDAKSKFIYSL